MYRYMHMLNDNLTTTDAGICKKCMHNYFYSYAVVVQYSAGVSTFYATLNTTTIPEGKDLTVKVWHS